MRDALFFNALVLFVFSAWTFGPPLKPHDDNNDMKKTPVHFFFNDGWTFFIVQLCVSATPQLLLTLLQRVAAEGPGPCHQWME